VKGAYSVVLEFPARIPWMQQGRKGCRGYLRAGELVAGAEEACLSHLKISYRIHLEP
jgi:hypothetical protein